MPWDLIGHIGLLSLWAACGLLPWFAAFLVRRGRGAFRALPVAVVAGIAGGVLVPVFAKGGTGVVISLMTATVAGAMATMAVLIRDRLEVKPS